MNSTRQSAAERMSARMAILGVIALGAAMATGCGGGGQDFGGMSSNLGSDIANPYNTSLASKGTGMPGSPSNASLGVYPMIDTSFDLASVPGDPFDYEKVNVQVTLKRPDGSTVDVPAFFDGGTTWRMRYSPFAAGTYAVVSVKLNKVNAHESNLANKEWTVKGNPLPGFVRVDKADHNRFMFDNGGRYFPIGHDQAWHSAKLPEIPDMLAKMHDAGENWTRIWMTHWDGKNLDWPASGKSTLGAIDLNAAKKWDAIVNAAASNSVYIQLTIQHHGQYSTQVDPNWNENPYNVKNGGFLKKPEDFFTDPQARALTKRKLYYMIARWGYSPYIMGWELFNEVENTDAMRSKHNDDVLMWHREMALFLKQYDGYRHLITTSSASAIPLESPIWDTVDYVQEHIYPTDVISALVNRQSPARKKLDKPYFIGEFGAANGAPDPRGIALHNGLWASLVSGTSGAAEYWYWDGVEQNNLYHEFQPAASYVTASGLADQGGLTTASLTTETKERAALSFTPSGGWGAAKQLEFIVPSSGAPVGIDQFPSYFQGRNHHDMMPKPLTFQVNAPQQTAFNLTVSQVAKAGAHIVISVDGKSVDHIFTAGDADYRPKATDATLTAPVPQGVHTISIINDGADWVQFGPMSLNDFAPALAANAVSNKNFVAAWVYNRNTIDGRETAEAAITGSVILPKLKAGKYRATWWDTHTGKSISEADITEPSSGSSNIKLDTPPVTTDVALYVTSATVPKSSAKGRRQRTSSQTTTTASSPSVAPAISPAASGSATADTGTQSQK